MQCGWHIPRSASDPDSGPKPINAKVETVATNRAFRDSFRGRRCLLPATGFYEWAATPAGKRPVLFRPHAGLVGLAGVWDVWKPPGGGDPLYTVAVNTTAANGLVGPVHARMPAVIPPDRFAAWLDPKTDPAEAAGLAATWPADLMAAVPVGPAVNSPRTDGPECVAPAG